MTSSPTEPTATSATDRDVTELTFDAVLFDMDGTLVDSSPAVLRSWLQWADEFGVDPVALQGFHGVTAAGIIAAAAPQVDQAAALARIIDIETNDVADVVTLPGAAEALATLGDRAIVVTSASEVLAKARLGAAGLSPRAMVSADDITHGKPDPEPYLLGARLMGAEPERCLVVEDAPSGLASGRAAGATTLAVVTTTPREELQADLIVPDLSYVRFTLDDNRIRLTLTAG